MKHTLPIFTAFISISTVAMLTISCARVTISAGQTIAFKDIKNRQVILSERPDSGDSIMITIVKKKPIYK